MFFKIGALKNFTNSNGKIPVLEPLFQKVGPSGLKFYSKETPTQVFSYEVCCF